MDIGARDSESCKFHIFYVYNYFILLYICVPLCTTLEYLLLEENYFLSPYIIKFSHELISLTREKKREIFSADDLHHTRARDRFIWDENRFFFLFNDFDPIFSTLTENKKYIYIQTSII